MIPTSEKTRPFKTMTDFQEIASAYDHMIQHSFAVYLVAAWLTDTLKLEQ